MTARVSMEVRNSLVSWYFNLFMGTYPTYLYRDYHPVTKYQQDIPVNTLNSKNHLFLWDSEVPSPTGTQPERMRSVKPRHLTTGSMESTETLRLGKELDASVTPETPDVPKGRRRVSTTSQQ